MSSTDPSPQPRWTFGFTRTPGGDRIVQPFAATRARQRHYAGMPYAAVLVDATGAARASLEVSLFAPQVDVAVFDAAGEVVLERRFGASAHRHFLFAERDTTYLDQAGRRALRPRTRNFVEQPQAGGLRDGRLIPGARLHHRLEPVPDFGGFAPLLRTDRRRAVDGHAEDSPARLAVTATRRLVRELAESDALPPEQVG